MGSGSYTLSPKVEAPKQETKPAKPAEPEYNKPVIKSPTHPKQDAWYNLNDVKFVWDLPKGVVGVSIGFDEKNYGDPGPVSDGLLSEKEYSDVKDGIHYFHLKYKDSRKWGTVANYKVMIDTSSPEDFNIEVMPGEAGDWPELRFQAVDKQSGLKQYEVTIGSLEENSYIVEAEKASLKVSDLEVGEHTALVKAVDNAGNSAYSEINFTVAPIEAPVITNYPAEITSGDQLFVSGTALPNATINLFVQPRDKAIIKQSGKSDNNGNWFFANKDNLGNGRYIIWAEAINGNGIKSGPSNKISVLVSPPIFTRIGSFVINYFTVLVSLLFLILLIIALVIFIIWLIRKKLKKETVEVEQILKVNAEEMKKSINKEFENIGKQATKAAANKEKESARARLLNKIDENTKKSLKEIKDVEDLLK